MFKKLIKILMIMLVVSFFAIILRYYFSEKNIAQKKQNRNLLETKVIKDISNLPELLNNTNDVIEFNSGFDNSNKQNFKRNFWDLFKD
tara:strand:+ start:846 stop:1109 length:264 start_codon:yes stop_codon:yes gene_type:complete